MLLSPGYNSLLRYHCKQFGNHRPHCDASVIAHVRFVTRLVDRSNEPNRQTFREMASKHAVEQPKQALLHTVTSIFDHVCKDAIIARAFATLEAFNALTQLISSNVLIQACIIWARCRYT